MAAFGALFLLGLVMGVGALILALLANNLSRALQSQGTGIAGFIMRVTLAPVNAVLELSHKLIGIFGPIAAGPQRVIGGALHDFARLSDRMAAAIVFQSEVTLNLAQAIAGTLAPGKLSGDIAKLRRQVGNAEAQARGIGNDVTIRLGQATAGIEAGVKPILNSLDKELTRVENQTIPRINHRVRTAEKSIENLWEWTRKHTVIAATTAFAGAVAWALTRIGGGWIRCNNWNKIGKSVCGLPSGLISSLLSGLIDVLVVRDLCEIITLMSSVARDVEPEIAAFIQVADALIGCGGVTKPAALSVSGVALAPVTVTVALG